MIRAEHVRDVQPPRDEHHLGVRGPARSSRTLRLVLPGLVLDLHAHLRTEPSRRLVLALDRLAAAGSDRGASAGAHAGELMRSVSGSSSARIRADQVRVVSGEDHLSVPARPVSSSEVVEGRASTCDRSRGTVVFELTLDAVLDAADLFGPPLDSDVGGGALEREDVVDLDGAGRRGKTRQAGESCERPVRARRTKVAP